MAKPELKGLCRELRKTALLSVAELAKRLGVSKGTVSLWVRGIPLPKEELARRDLRKRRGGNKKSRGELSRFYQMVDVSRFSRQQKAKIAEAAVLYRLCLYGLSPFCSVFDGDKTDWLVEVPGENHVLRLQVKWASSKHKTGLPIISLVCTEGHNKTRSYKEGEFDFLVGYDLYSDTCYVFSWSDVSSLTTSITIRPEAAERWDLLLRSPR